MNHHHQRRILTTEASRLKRKEREPFCSAKPPPPVAVTATTSSKAADQPASSNQLLAGYMAYEFLTKGTLLGEKFDSARAESVPLSAQSKRGKLGKSKSGEAEPSGKAKPQHPCYAEVANLLMIDGVHIPGIVNPTQLHRWIQM